MTLSKRVFDLCLLAVLIVPLLPVGLIIGLVILMKDGAPVFYVSERMKTGSEAFNLIKFRTMTQAAQNGGVSGGDKTGRITKTGAFLRRTRLDEIPQLWNILRGDMSFVGPRPPLRRYVDMYPALYGEVLQMRPGVTGLATMRYHKTEERLLAVCTSPQETEAVYTARCIPRKAAFDRIYARHQSVCFDAKLVLVTMAKVFGLDR